MKIRCPDCKRGMITRAAVCPVCRLRWEDFDAAAELYARIAAEDLRRRRV